MENTISSCKRSYLRQFYGHNFYTRSQLVELSKVIFPNETTSTTATTTVAATTTSKSHIGNNSDNVANNQVSNKSILNSLKVNFETCDRIRFWLRDQPCSKSTSIITSYRNSLRIQFDKQIGDNLQTLFDISHQTPSAVQYHDTYTLVTNECHVVQSNNEAKINTANITNLLMVNFLQNQFKALACMFYNRGSFVTLSLLVFLILHNTYTASTTETSTRFQGISLALGIMEDIHNFTNPTGNISMNFVTIPTSLLQKPIGNTDLNINKGTNLIQRGLTFGNTKLNNSNEFTKGPEEKMSSFCQSCQIFEIGKMNSLEFVKQQILMHLQLSHPPNISDISSIPQRILDKFYNNLKKSNIKNSISQNTQYTQNIYISNNQRRSLYDKGNSPNDYVSNDKHRLSAESLDLDTNINAYLNPDIDGDNSTYIKYGIQNDDSNQQVFHDHQYDIKLDGSGIPINEDEYSSDLKRTNYKENFNNYKNNAESLYSDELYSHLHSIYIFPTVLYSRNRKVEVYNFKFNKDTLTIAHTILHIYIRGREWINIHKPHLLKNQSNGDKTFESKELVIMVYKILRSQNAINYTHSIKLFEAKYKIPSGLGQWIEIELKQLSTNWLINPNATQSIIIKGLQPWMQSLIVTNHSNNSKALAIHLEILVNTKKRQRRSIHLDCFEGDNEVRCCRYPLKVNFKQFNWSFIIAPEIFDAYWCHGECKIGFLEQHPHTHVTTLTTSAKPCCSPRKMSSLSLLYLDHQSNLFYVTIPNMSIDKCGCA